MPGTVSVTGKQLKSVEETSASRAGTVSLKLKLTAAGKKAMKKAQGHRLLVKVTIVFAPVGGTAGHDPENGRSSSSRGHGGLRAPA